MSDRGPLESLLRSALDPQLERAFRFAIKLNFPHDPALVGLAAHREEARRRTTAAFEGRARALEAGVVERDPEAIRRYDELIEEAVAVMRGARPEETVGGGPLRGAAILGAIERRLYKNAPERLDDPSYPEASRAQALEELDRFNQALGTYDSFIEILSPLIDAAERSLRAAGESRPVRVHDLASGHAGFAVLLKRSLGDRVDVEASDIKPEYLELGRARSAALGVRVDLFTEDALAMDGPRSRGVDVLLCTQALHHFPAGMVARMIGEASRAARTAACFIDGERSFLSLFRFLMAAPIYTRHRTLVHDGFVSIRRMFYKEELLLFASLAPGVPKDMVITTGSARPAHGFLTITRGASAG